MSWSFLAVIQEITWRNQDNHIYAFCYTAASLHMSDPRLRYKETRRLGSKIPQKSRQRNLSLAVSCNLPGYHICEQNLRVQQPPGIAHLMRNGLIGLHLYFPLELLLVLKGFLHPIHGMSCPDSLWQICVLQGATQRQRSSLNDQQLRPPSETGEEEYIKVVFYSVQTSRSPATSVFINPKLVLFCLEICFHTNRYQLSAAKGKWCTMLSSFRSFCPF